MRKKRIVINTDYSLVKTGLGRNGKELANYLYKTGKYEIIYYACGVPWSAPEYARFPYKVVGALPESQQELESLCRDPGQARAVSYGSHNIDRVIKEFKPDVLIPSNDFWASCIWTSKVWWNKIHCLPHKTADSVPFLPEHIEYIKNSKQFFVWADFATEEAKRLGFDHVKTLTGMIDSKLFYKLPSTEKTRLRNKFNIPENALVCGFVFRNQLRKELKPLLEGFAMFQKEHPKTPAYLLLHTHFAEPAGWDIPRFCKELGIDLKYILTTYVCKTCHSYEVKAFSGQDLKCGICGDEKGQTTCQVTNGIKEQELNEVYNLMDCYCHLLNAGGLEIPTIESLYCELPLATVGYSSGEMFTRNDFVYPITFTYTVQHGTQFKRAVPQPFSVYKFLKKIAETPLEERDSIGRRGREWANSKFSIEVVGKQWEEVLDALPLIDWDFNFTPKEKNPTAIIPAIPDDTQWLTVLYKEILDMAVDSNDPGLNHWLNRLKNGEKRETIEKFFRDTALNENQKHKQIDFGDILIKNDKKRFLIVAPESAGDCIYVTATLESFRECYPSETWDIYLATKPEYFELFEGCPFIDQILPYQPFMDSEIACTGSRTNKGYFDGYCFATAGAQRFLNYLTNHNLNITLT